jgi:hypothetical protein
MIKGLVDARQAPLGVWLQLAHVYLDTAYLEVR